VAPEAFPPQLVPASTETKLYQLHVYFSALFDQVRKQPDYSLR
jgi:hypothetical protein